MGARKEFEEWAGSFGWSLDRTEEGDYRTMSTDAAWGGWLAAHRKQAAQITALEAKVATLQALSDEYAERVTKEIEAVKLLRAALVHIHEYWNGEPNDVAMRDALDHIIDEADMALEATK